jgi:hypothetical protein
MDLVQRLRENAGPSGEWGEKADKLQIEAADEIERLREWQRQMVEIQASGGRLDGYRELADKLAARDKEIDRLRAENRQAKEAVAVLGAGRPLGDIVGLHTAQNAIAEAERLRAENAELRADAERYRALIAQAQKDMGFDALRIHSEQVQNKPPEE